MDFEQLLHDLQSEYHIGYVALCNVEGEISLFIQRHVDASSRMAMKKVKNICTKLAGESEVVPFVTPEGKIIESFGEFRSIGRKRQRGSDDERGVEEDVNTDVSTNVNTNVAEKATTPSTPQFVKRDATKRTHRGLAKDEELLVLGGKAYACREIPLP